MSAARADSLAVAEAVIAFCQERFPPYGQWTDSCVLIKDTDVPLQELANGLYRLETICARKSLRCCLSSPCNYKR